MGAQDITFNIASAEQGVDRIGFSQGSGTITATETSTGKYAGKLMITSAAHGLKKGMAINITNLDAPHNGLTKVLQIMSTSKVVLDIPFNVASTDQAGNWDLKGGSSAWNAMIPDVDIPAANISSISFFFPDREGGNAKAVQYNKGQLYVFPGVLKSILLVTAGDVVLIRASTKPTI